jgi:hypothetical protein
VKQVRAVGDRAGKSDLELIEAMWQILLMIGVPNERDEFVSAEAPDLLAVASPMNQALGNGADQRVTCEMAVYVVDLLQTVYIEKQQDETGRVVHGSSSPATPQMARRQLGDRITTCGSQSAALNQAHDSKSHGR